MAKPKVRRWGSKTHPSWQGPVKLHGRVSPHGEKWKIGSYNMIFHAEILRVNFSIAFPGPFFKVVCSHLFNLHNHSENVKSQGNEGSKQTKEGGIKRPK